MVRRAIPLFVDVRVAALACIGLHEVFPGNVAAVFGLRRTREEFSMRAVAFAIHRGWRGRRILDAVSISPGYFARPPSSSSDGCGKHEQRGEPCRSLCYPIAKPSA